MLQVGKTRKKLTNSRIALGLDNMLRNYRNLKTNPSLRMQNFPKISWSLFGEAILRIGYEHLKTYEREKGLAATLNLILSSGLNTRWANLPQTRFRSVPLNVWVSVTSREILQRHLQYIKEAMKKADLKPVTWRYFLHALLDIGLWQVENMLTKDATYLILMTVAQFDIETLAETRAKLVGTRAKIEAAFKDSASS